MSRGGRPVALKRYSRLDTATYKCWGSGVANEGLVGHLLSTRTPELLRTWSEPAAECAELEWLPGTQPGPMSAELARSVGRMLGHQHRVSNRWWGSLDGSYSFATAAEAFRSRFAAGLETVGRVRPDLARAAERWARPRLADLRLPGPPALVHGDFGPTNLLIDEETAVIDWEHARWGHPQEEWAKIRLALDFPEPNGFPGRNVLAEITTGWRDVTGTAPPADPFDELLLRLYYAMCLGVFFWPRDVTRLVWVEALVTGGA